MTCWTGSPSSTSWPSISSSSSAATSTLEDASRSGERPRPVCMVAKDLRTGQTWELFRGEFGSQPPFPTGPDSVLIAYYASAELVAFEH